MTRLTEDLIVYGGAAAIFAAFAWGCYRRPDILLRIVWALGSALFAMMVTGIAIAIALGVTGAGYQRTPPIGMFFAMIAGSVWGWAYAPTPSAAGEWLARFGLRRMHGKIFIATMITWTPIWYVGTTKLRWISHYYWYAEQWAQFFAGLLAIPFAVPLAVWLWQWALAKPATSSQRQASPHHSP